LEKLKKSVETGENYFLENNSDLNNEYYQKFLKYDADYKKMESELKKNKLELEKNNHENSIDQNSYRKRIEELKVRIDRHLKLEQSILQNDNLFKVNDVSEKEYYHKYLEFESKVKKYTQVIKQKEENYEIYKNLGEEVVPKKEIQDRKNELEAAALELKVFKDEYLSNLRTDIEKYRRELTELEYNLKKTDEYNSYYKNDSLNNEKYSSLSLQQYKNNTLVNINDGIKGLREKIKKSEEELKLVNINIEERIVKAPIDGKINILMEINKGDLLQPGTEILTIIPNVNSEFKVQLSVLNKDIADIKEGSLIKYHFLALPYKEYGELTGKITKISTDSNVSPQDGKSYYNVEATIENRPLHSYKGKVAYIKVGMAVEAHVVTKTQKILYYMLEKINLRD
jgi:HlyD family secretion protein